MNSSNIRNRMTKGIKIVISTLFVFIAFFIFDINQSYAQIVIPVITMTVESTADGGKWNDSSTWIDDVVPLGNDNVKINGPVVLNRRDPIMQNIDITTNGSLSPSNPYNRNFYVEGNFTNKGNLDSNLIFHVAGNIHNTGIFDGNINLTGSSPRTIISADNSVINLTERLTLVGDTSFNNIRTNNHEIFFQEVNNILSITKVHGNINTNGNISVGLECSFNTGIYTAQSIRFTENCRRPLVREYFVDDFIIDENVILDLTYGYGGESLIVHGNFENNGIIEGNGSIVIEGDFHNNNEVSQNIRNIVLDGTEPRSVYGVENQIVSLQTDVFIENNDISFSYLFSNGNELNFTHDKGTIVTSGLHGNGIFRTNSVLKYNRVNETRGYGYLNFGLDEIYAQKIIIDFDSGAGFFKVHLYADFIVNEGAKLKQYYQWSDQSLYFHGNVLNNGEMDIREGAYFYKNIENNGIWNDGNGLRLSWEGDESVDYEFVIDKESENISNVQTLIGNIFHNIFSFIDEKETKYFWKWRLPGGEWSEIHTVNVPLYLETQENFFTITEIPNITQNTETEITITSTDPTYRGDITLAVSTGRVTPNILHIEDGVLTTHISFDTAQENISLSIGSDNHGTLRGESNKFNILHAIQNSFFTMPAVIEAQTERTLVIPLSAEEADYTGRVLGTYYYRNQQGIEESIALPELDIQQWQATFSYAPQFFSVESYFSFVDKDYLRGRSLPFLVKKKKKRHGSSVSSQHVNEVFFGQGDDGEETELSEEDGEIEIDVESDEEQGEENEQEQEEESPEPEFLLENECLDIHSIYPVLSKSLRSKIKAIPNEKQNVKNLQQKLKDLHFLLESVDGDFGPGTKQALIDFQEQNNLFVDGIFGNVSSQFIQTNCQNLNEKIIPEIDDEQNDEQNSEQEEQGSDQIDGENIFENFEDDVSIGWDVVTDWFNGLFGSNNQKEESENEDTETQTPVSLLFERPDGTILEILYTELYDVETNTFSDHYALIEMFDIEWTSSNPS